MVFVSLYSYSIRLTILKWSKGKTYAQQHVIFCNNLCGNPGVYFAWFIFKTEPFTCVVVSWWSCVYVVQVLHQSAMLHNVTMNGRKWKEIPDKKAVLLLRKRLLFFGYLYPFSAVVCYSFSTYSAWHLWILL